MRDGIRSGHGNERTRRGQRGEVEAECGGTIERGGGQLTAV